MHTILLLVSFFGYSLYFLLNFWIYFTISVDKVILEIKFEPAAEPSSVWFVVTALELEENQIKEKYSGNGHKTIGFKI